MKKINNIVEKTDKTNFVTNYASKKIIDKIKFFDKKLIQTILNFDKKIINNIVDVVRSAFKDENVE